MTALTSAMASDPARPGNGAGSVSVSAGSGQEQDRMHLAHSRTAEIQAGKYSRNR
jgi:hypothetical protein